MDYYFEELQQLKFDVLDVDDWNNPNNISSADFLGTCEGRLADIVVAKGATWRTKLMNQKGEQAGRSWLTVRIELIIGNPNDMCSLTLSCSSLPKMDLLGTADVC